MSDLSKRIMVRVTERQEAWISEQAADEGMDNATFVRVLIDRLSKGRAPLIGMMQPIREISMVETAFEYGRGPAIDVLPELGVANAKLAERLAEAEALIPEGHAETDAEEAPAAIPLTRISRPRFNPGRN